MNSIDKGCGGANVKHICTFDSHLAKNYLTMDKMILFIHILKPPKFKNYIFNMPLVFMWRTISWVGVMGRWILSFGSIGLYHQKEIKELEQEGKEMDRKYNATSELKRI